MPIRGPLKDSDGKQYWTIDNVDAKYYNEEKAKAALRAIKAKQSAKASAEEIENWVLEGIGRGIELTEADIESVKEKRELKDVELLRVGTYADATGKIFKATKKVIEDLVSTFSEPISGNLDHRRSGAACGWIQSLRQDGDKLLADIGDISTSFWKRLQEKEFVNRSVEVAKVDGKWLLEGFAWLGARRPAVKGMSTLQFADDDGNVIRIILPKEDNMPDPNAAALQEDLGKTKHELSEAEKARVAAEEKSKEATTKLAEADKKLADAEKQLAEVSLQAAKTDVKAYLDKLIKDGQLVPAMRKAGLDELMLSIATLDTVIELSEKDKIVKCSPLDTLKKVLEAAPKNVIRFSEQTGHNLEDPSEPGAGTDGLAQRIDAYVLAHDCSEDEAVDAVTRIAAAERRSKDG